MTRPPSPSCSWPPYALSCVIPLRDAPPERDVTNVTFNGLVVPRDTEHVSGWDTLATPTSTNIELYGSWCDQLTASRYFEVNVSILHVVDGV